MLRRKNVKNYIMSVWQLETSIDLLKSIRASFPCKSRLLWKRSIVWVTITRDLLKRMCLIYTYRLNNKYIFSEKSYTIIRFMQCSSSKSSIPGIWQSPSGMRKRKWNESFCTNSRLDVKLEQTEFFVDFLDF